ncbi:hypothetical protein ABPG74_013718 [Tetrahymena malaccensis]
MLRKLDFFGSQIQLRFNKEPTYKSKIGSTATLFIIGFIGFRFVSIFLSVYYRENPFLIFTQRQVDDPNLFVATSKTFPLAFALEDQNNQFFIDQQIYTVKAQLQQKYQVFNNTSQKYDIVYKSVNIEVKPCTVDNFQNPDNSKYFLKLNYNNMYCFDPDSQLGIQGDFPSPIFSQIMLKVFKCQVNCKSDSIVNMYLQKIYFGLQLSDAYVDITKKDNPFQMYSRDFFWPISSSQQKDVTVYIRNNYVYSDFGWFFSDMKTQIFPSFSYQNIDVFPVQNNNNYILSVTFRFEKQQENVYRRSYLDFFGIISQIGGFANTLLAIGFLICRQVSQLKLNQNIINQIFNYNESQVEKVENDQLQDLQEKSPQKQNKQIQQPSLECQSQLKDLNNKQQQKYEMNSQVIQSSLSIYPSLQQQQISQTDETSDQSINSFINNNSPNNQTRTPQNISKKVEKEFSKLLNQQTHSMKMSIWEYFLSYLCPFGKLKKKKETIQYSIDMLYQNLDILQILKRLIEVEKLKRILLDADQIKLFDYLPKPTIDLDLILHKQSTENIYKSKEVNLLYQDNRSEMQKAKDAFEAYKKIKHKKNFTMLDQKIVEMLDQNLVQIFEAQKEDQILDQTQCKQNNHLQKKKQISSLFLKTQTEKNKNLDQLQDVTNGFISQIDNPRQFEFHFQPTQQQSINNCKDNLTQSNESNLKYNSISVSELGEIAQEDFQNKIPDHLQKYNISQK